MIVMSQNTININIKQKRKTDVCYQDNDTATKAKRHTLANNTVTFLCPIQLRVTCNCSPLLLWLQPQVKGWTNTNHHLAYEHQCQVLIENIDLSFDQ